MRLILIALLSFVCAVTIQAQTITGQVLDIKTKQAISFANIGIVNKGVGTMTDENGNFSLKLDDKYNDDVLKISLIGYKYVSFKVLDFKAKYGSAPAKIYLEENTYSLSEVVVRPVKYKTKVVGNKDTGSPCVDFIGDTAKKENEGVEVGTLIKIDQPTFIDAIGFGVCRNDFDSIMLRLNIYGKDNENLLKKAIYVWVKKSDKKVAVDMKKYNIKVENDFIIAIEALNLLQTYDEKKHRGKGKGFSFSGGLFGSDLLIRKNIYDKWEKVSVAVIGFNATVTYEDKGNWFINLFK